MIIEYHSGIPNAPTLRFFSINIEHLNGRTVINSLAAEIIVLRMSYPWNKSFKSIANKFQLCNIMGYIQVKTPLVISPPRNATDLQETELIRVVIRYCVFLEGQFSFFVFFL